ncbi:hypothetical protein L7F22_006107 [Adiantum nelumboides]|nr:hypothetical protein [Adiantum nelumboides]
MESSEQKSKKLPTGFSKRVFSIMEVRYGAKRCVEPGDILVDTFDHVLGDKNKEDPPGQQSKNARDEDPPSKEQLSGHKRRRPGKVAEMIESLEASSVKLVDVFASVEKRAKQDQDLIEITREEYEAARELNAKRLELERARLNNECDNNLALFKIASAIEAFSSKLHV